MNNKNRAKSRIALLLSLVFSLQGVAFGRMDMGAYALPQAIALSEGIEEPNEGYDEGHEETHEETSAGDGVEEPDVQPTATQEAVEPTAQATSDPPPAEPTQPPVQPSEPEELAALALACWAEGELAASGAYLDMAMVYVSCDAADASVAYSINGQAEVAYSGPIALTTAGDYTIVVKAGGAGFANATKELSIKIEASGAEEDETPQGAVSLQPIDGVDISWGKSVTIHVAKALVAEHPESVRYTIAQAPVYGSAWVDETTGNLIYTALEGAQDDAVTVRAANKANSAEQKIEFTVYGPPVVTDDFSLILPLMESRASTLLDAIAKDPSEKELTWTVLTPPAYGQLSLTDTDLAYEADAEFTGEDAFVLHVQNEYHEVTIAIPVTYPTLIQQDNMDGVTLQVALYDTGMTELAASVATNGSLLFDIAAALDEEAGPWMLTSVWGATQSLQCEMEDGKLRYVPQRRAAGVDYVSFTAHAIDDEETIQAGVVAITIDSVNDPHTVAIAGGSINATEGTPFTFSFVVTDADYTDAGAFNVAIASDNADVFGNSVQFDTTQCSPSGDEISYTVQVTPLAQAYTAEGSPATLTVTVSDGTHSDSDSVSVSVAEVNDPPTADLPANGEIAEDGVYSIQFTISDPDINPDTGFFVSASSGNEAVLPSSAIDVSLQGWSGNTATYVLTALPLPYQHAAGGVLITLTISDGTNEITPALTLVITPENNPPVAGDDTYGFVEDTPLTIQVADILALATDPDFDTDGDAVSWGGIRVQPAHGTLDPQYDGGKVVALLYTPGKDKETSTSFVYWIQDKTGATDDGTITLTCTPQNDAPVAVNDTYAEVLEDVRTDLFVTKNDYDVDTDDNFTICDFDGNMEGSLLELSEDGKRLYYTSAPNYHGSDSFRYRIEDNAEAKSNYATVTLTILSVNDLPEFRDINSIDVPYTQLEDTQLEFTVTVFDVETEAETLFMQASIPSESRWLVESVIVSAGATNDKRVVTVVPKLNQNGEAPIVLLLTDVEEAIQQRVTVKFTAENDAPVATNKSFPFKEDTPIEMTIEEIMAGDSDVDIATNDDEIVFDSYVYSGGHGEIEEIWEDGKLVGLKYTPGEDAEANDSFQYTIRDSFGETSTATVTLICTPENDAPRITAVDPQTIDEDDSLELQLVYYDPETPTEQLVVTVSSSDETIVNATGISIDRTTQKLTITPLPNMNGEVVITVRVSDTEKVEEITFILSITPQPDDPTAMPDEYTAIAGRRLPFNPLENDYDVDDGDEITLVFPLAWAEDYGDQVQIEGTDASNLSFIASAGVEGTFLLNYTIEDSTQRQKSSTVTFHVKKFGTGPMLGGLDTIEIRKSQKSKTIDIAVANVPEGDAYSLSVIEYGAGNMLPDSALSLGGGSNREVLTSTNDTETTTTLTLTPPVPTVGTTMIRVNLEYGDKTDSLYVRVIFIDINDPPVAVDDLYDDLIEGEPRTLDVLKNDHDTETPDEDLEIFSVEMKSGHGEVYVSSDRKKVEYRAPWGYSRSYFHGTVTFEYTVIDGAGEKSKATATLIVAPVETDPRPFGEHIIVPEHKPIGTPVTISSLLNNDIDYDDWSPEHPNSGEWRGIAGSQTSQAEIVSVSVRYLDGDGYTDNSYVVDGDPSSFTFTPNGSGWYEVVYTMRTPSTDNGGWRMAQATSYIGVTEDDGIVPRISGNSYSQREECVEPTKVTTRDISGHIHALNKKDVTVYEAVIVQGEDLVYPEDTTIVKTSEDKFELTIRPKVHANGTVKVQLRIAQTIKGVEYVTAPDRAATYTITIEPVNDAPEFISVDESALATIRRAVETAIPIKVWDMDNAFEELRLTATTSDGDALIVPPSNIRIERVEAGGEGEDTYYEYMLYVKPIADTFEKPSITMLLTLSDGDKTVTEQIFFDVLPNNTPPIFEEGNQSRSFTINEDGQGEYNVVSWGYDEDGDMLSIVDGSISLTYRGKTRAEDPNAGDWAQEGKLIVYTPAQDYYTDLEDEEDYILITYKLQDTKGAESETGEIRIRIRPVNDPPEVVTLQKEYTGQEDIPREITFVVRDVDLDALTYAVSCNDAEQKYVKSMQIAQVAEVEPGVYEVKVTIVPADDAFHGENDPPVKITVTVTDDEGLSAEASFDFRLNAVNDAVRPINPENLVLKEYQDEDKSIDINLTELFEDIDGEAGDISVIKFGNAEHGTVVKKDMNTVTFTPHKDFCNIYEEEGDETKVPLEDWAYFDYTVSDLYNGTCDGKVYIFFYPVNDPPEARNVVVNLKEDDDPVEFDIMYPGHVSDIDNGREDISVQIISEMVSTKGTLAVADISDAPEGSVARFTYTPAKDQHGQDERIYAANDLGEEPSNQARIIFNIESVKDWPRLSFDGSDNEVPDESTYSYWEMDEDTVGTFSVHAWQPEDTNLSMKIYIDEDEDNILARKDLNLTGSGERYTVSIKPGENQFGVVLLRFELSDGTYTITRFVEVTVKPVNDLPIFKGLPYAGGQYTIAGQTLMEDAWLSNTVTVSDIEDAAALLTVEIAEGDQPQHGTAEITGSGATRSWTYTPAENYYGNDSFRITLRDTEGGVAYAKVLLKVDPVNDPPSAPGEVELDKEYYVDAEGAGPTVTVSWTPGADIPGETAQETLRYDIDVTYNGSTWTSVREKYVPDNPSGDRHSLAFPAAPGQNTDTLKVRIRTVDNGVGIPEEEKSGYTTSGAKKIDNTAPRIEYTLSTNDYTNEAVTVTVTVQDTGAGSTGVAVDGVMLDGVTKASSFTFTTDVNDAFTVVAQDVAGNESRQVIAVTKIDKLLPFVSAEIVGDTSGDIFADSEVKIKLTYTDAAATDDDAQSGVAQYLYALVKDTKPNADSIADWRSGSDTTLVDIKEKGTWYLAVKAVDRAGNVYTTVFEDEFVLTVTNSDPVVEKPVAVEVNEGGTVTIDMSKFITDADGYDDMTFSITPGDDMLSCSGKALQETGRGKYVFTHNGDGTNPFQGTLTFTYSVSNDGEVKLANQNGTITVKEINDKPAAPTLGTLENTIYKKDQTIPLTWTHGEDEETPSSALIYEVDITYDGGASWTSVASDQAGISSYAVPVTFEGNSKNTIVRVRARDTGRLGDGEDKKYSEYATVAVWLDNTPPAVAWTLSPSTWTNGPEVAINLTVTESLDGDSGIQSVMWRKQGDDNWKTLLGDYSFTTEQNGTFEVTATDNMGNARTVDDIVVSNIDRHKPGVVASPTSIADTANVYADSKQTVTLTPSDVEANNYGASGVKITEYELVTQENAPSADSFAFTAAKRTYKAPIALDMRGNHYIVARVEDIAGNEHVEVFGPYFINDRAPVVDVDKMPDLAVQEIEGNSVRFDLKACTTDADGIDKVTFTVGELSNTTVGKLEKDGAEQGKYVFTHNGEGRPTFVESVSFEFTAKDDMDQTATGTITIHITEVNDVPVPPDVAFADATGFYTDGETINITWEVDETTDEETGAADLTFDIYVNMGSGFTKLVEGYEDTSYAYEIALGERNTDALAFQIRTRDKGLLTAAQPNTDVKTSSWVSSPAYRVDNLAPVFESHALQASDPTNEDVTISLVITDNRTADSGIAEVTIGEETLAGPDYAYTVEHNGDYIFVAVDGKGNASDYKVQVRNIDKLSPTISASPTNISFDDEVYKEDRSVALTYLDQDANDENGKSGLVSGETHYALIADTSEPTVESMDDITGWEACDETESVLLGEKGTWFIAARTIDVAGNETINVFGPYVVRNSPPQLVSETPVSLLVDEGGQVTFDLYEYVTDVDTEIASIEINDPGIDEAEGAITYNGETKQWTFAHSGKGNPFVGELSFTYTAYDDEGATVVGNGVITVTELNNDPALPTVDGPAEGTAYKDGDTLALAWTHGDDQETDGGDLTYQVQINYTGQDDGWQNVKVLADAYTGNTLNVTIASDGLTSAAMKLRIKARDTGTTIGGLNPKETEWVNSPVYLLDNTAPTVTDGGLPTSPTKESVTFEVSYVDEGVATTDIDTVYRYEALLDGEYGEGILVKNNAKYTVTAEYNGKYKYVVTDGVGNTTEYIVVIDQIDKLKPTISASPSSISFEDEVYREEQSITLTYLDQDADDENIKSGLVSGETHYALIADTSEPTVESMDDITGWEACDETESVLLGEKGTWFIAARTIDVAGNETINVFGPYVVRNSPPQLVSETPVSLLVDEGGQVTFDLYDYVTDVDTEIASIEINDPGIDEAEGEITYDGGSKQWTFAHSGKGKPFVGELSFTYTAYDDEGASVVGNGIITVIELNNDPALPTVDGPAEGTAYKDDDTLALAWTHGDDQETDGGDLTYQVQINYTGQDDGWQNVKVLADAYTGNTLNVTIASDGQTSAAMQLRIKARDTGTTIGGLNPKETEWVESPMYLLDNTAPTVTDGGLPTSPTKESVTFEVSYVDEGVVTTGIDTVYRYEALLDGEYGEGILVTNNAKDTVVAEYNGKYKYVVTDGVGNTTEYFVVIDQIDKLAPTIDVDTQTIDSEARIHADSGETLTLAYADAAADALGLNMVSGLDGDEIFYALVARDSIPAQGNIDAAAWTACTADTVVPLDEKGNWYLAAKVKDVAGNETFAAWGPYYIWNAPLEWTAVAREIEVYEGGTASIDLSQYVRVTDDEESIASYSITEDNTSDHGTLTIGESSGEGSFVHDGEGNPFVDTLTFTIRVTDTGGMFITGTVTITVVEVNDQPANPIVAALEPDTYRDGQTLTLSWAHGDDEETDGDDLLYEAQVRYQNAGEWIALKVEADAYTGNSLVVEVASEGITGDEMSLRIRARDTGTLSDNDDPKWTAWVETGPYGLDNTAPTVDNDTLSDAYTNKDVEFDVTFADEGAVTTGVASVTLNGTEIGPGLALHHVRAEHNGTYTFVVYDGIGNVTEHEIEVDKIDKLAPAIESDVAAIGANEDVRADDGTQVTLSFADQAATSLYAKSDLAQTVYAVIASDEKPNVADISDWTDGECAQAVQIDLDEKGSWYIATKATDAAGNDITAVFGPYVIHSICPVLSDVERTLSVDEGGTTETFSLKPYVTVLDPGGEITSVEIISTPDAKYGAIAYDFATDSGTFTHSGEGTAPFADTLTFTFRATDTAGETIDGDVIIYVRELNDAPEAPVITAPISGQYKDEDTFTFTWTHGDDEETAGADLTYEIEIDYAGDDDWQTVEAAGYQGTSAAIEVDSGKINSDEMRLRIRATDTGVANVDNSAITTDWVTSEALILDNAPPVVDQSEIKAGDVPYTLGEDAMDIITYGFTLEDEGLSGLQAFGYMVSGEDTAPENPALYTMSGSNGGSYAFDTVGTHYMHLYMVDNVGNVSYDTIGPFVVANTRPKAMDQEVTVNRGDTVDITLEGVDPEGDALTYHVDQDGLTQGTLAQKSETVYTFTPSSGNTDATDSFTFTVKDVHDISSEEAATVRINIKAVEEVGGESDDEDETKRAAERASSVTSRTSSSPRQADAAASPADTLVWWVQVDAKPKAEEEARIETRLNALIADELEANVHIQYMRKGEIIEGLLMGEAFDLALVQDMNVFTDMVLDKVRLRDLSALVEALAPGLIEKIPEDHWTDARLAVDGDEETLRAIPLVVGGQVRRKADNDVVTVVNDRSAYVEKAVKLLEYAMLEDEFNMTLHYGIADEHYQTDAEGQVHRTAYGLQAYCPWEEDVFCQRHGVIH